MSDQKSTAESIEVRAANNLRGVLEAIGSGSLTASATQLAYLEGAAGTLESLAATAQELYPRPETGFV